MAKGQKKSNREVRKPKQDKAKSSAAPSSFLATAERNSGGAPGAKRPGR
jgi:hypothetical protein